MQDASPCILLNAGTMYIHTHRRVFGFFFHLHQPRLFPSRSTFFNCFLKFLRFLESVPLCKCVAVEGNAVQLACMVPFHEPEQSSLVSLHRREEWASSTALAVILRGRDYDEVGLVCSWGGLCILSVEPFRGIARLFGCIVGRCSYTCIFFFTIIYYWL